MKLPEIKISVKFKNRPESLPKIRNSVETHKVLRKLFDDGTIEWREEFMMLCLNAANELIGFFKVSTGGMTGSVVDARIIFTVALNTCAHSIIVCHNHPSGNLSPSTEDVRITRQLVEAGKLLDIKVLDHIILTKLGFYTFAEHGLI